jgi:hypothetical protein
VRFKGEPIHNPNATHPCAIPFRTGLAELFGSPLRHGDRGGTIGTHESVANEARLRTEYGKAIGLNLTKDVFRFR